ncbi:cellulose-binding domain-containing protein [Micromonospora sp. R77]|uniref:cellulose binding domain-containing protein n=1 Tax=Micromonospora sp. R77 TaxID=2925836 RepID=UPI001F607BDE|nr:cellulose binding domain-containing protein [Micromonospora sp. R77]MCI4061587.1 cellulose-binding domain-containing protein [Micromonospora sp. R77]
MSGTRRARSSPGTSTAIASSPWVVVSIGVIVMVVLLVVALGAARGRRPYRDAEPVPPPATVPLPELPSPTPSPVEPTATGPVVPGLSPRSTVLPSTGGPVARTSASSGGGAGSGRPTPPPPPSPAPVPPPALVTGRYQVVDTFDGGFIGEVRLSNTDSTARGWTVRLVFPDGRLVTSWVEGAEQGRAGVSGDVFTYTSGVDLSAGASVSLRFHYETSGTTRPAQCTVDGAACSGL